jgi:hypothetical protein
MAFLQDIVFGFEWLGQEIAKAASWVPTVLTVVEDLAQDVDTLLPEVVSVITDVENLALSAIKDGGQAISSGQVLILAITQATSAGILDVAADEAVVAAFKGFVTEVGTKSTWSDVMTAMTQMIQDYDTFGASAKAAVVQLKNAV